MKKEETLENYLEVIHILSLQKKGVKAIDIANYLGYSRATVSIALKELEKNDYIVAEKLNLFLTDKGLKIANSIYERHEVIANALIKLGVDEITAYRDACLIEHDLSDKTFAAVKKYIRNQTKKSK